jgi:hypothetical protein
MSTRANIIITDGYQNQIFYRHSDGYPEGVTPTLQKFVDWVAEGKIRNNTGQAAGWLIMLGALEYQTVPKLKEGAKKYRLDLELGDGMMDWKVGAYEPTDGVHGDIEYLYLIDLRKPCVKMKKVSFSSELWKIGNINIEKKISDLYAKTKIALNGDAALYDFIEEMRKMDKKVAGMLNPEFVKDFKGKVIIKPTPKVQAEVEPVVTAKHTIIVKQADKSPDPEENKLGRYLD